MHRAKTASENNITHQHREADPVQQRGRTAIVGANVAYGALVRTAVEGDPSPDVCLIVAVVVVMVLVAMAVVVAAYAAPLAANQRPIIVVVELR